MSITRHQAVGAYRPWVPEDFGAPPHNDDHSAPEAGAGEDGFSPALIPMEPAPEPVQPEAETLFEPAPEDDAAEQEPTLELPEDFRLPTAEEIERMHEDIRAAAAAEGHHQGHEEGFAQGLAEGERKGYEEGLAQAQAEARQLAQLVERLDTSLRTVDQEVAEELMALAIELARQMVHDCLRAQPETILDTIHQALQQLPQIDARIELHPADLALANSLLGEELAELGHRLQESPALQRGDCLIEAQGAQLDATLETRWRRTLASLGREHSSFHSTAPEFEPGLSDTVAAAIPATMSVDLPDATTPVAEQQAEQPLIDEAEPLLPGDDLHLPDEGSEP